MSSKPHRCCLVSYVCQFFSATIETLKPKCNILRKCITHWENHRFRHPQYQDLGHARQAFMLTLKASHQSWSFKQWKTVCYMCFSRTGNYSMSARIGHGSQWYYHIRRQNDLCWGSDGGFQDWSHLWKRGNVAAKETLSEGDFAKVDPVSRRWLTDYCSRVSR